MLARITGNNQLALPKAVVAEMGDPEYFDVRIENGRVVLEPVHIQRADAVRPKLAELGIGEQDIADAVVWARGRKKCEKRRGACVRRGSQGSPAIPTSSSPPCCSRGRLTWLREA